MTHFFPLNSTLEEDVFASRNLDKDCQDIAERLDGVGNRVLSPMLEAGRFLEAVRLYLQILDSLTVHFVKDEHWRWFDDYYAPDYSVSWMWERFVPLIRSGALAGEDLALLKRGLAAIESSAAFRQYGYPSRVPLREARFVCVG